MTVPGLTSRVILGMRTDATSYSEAATQILAWARTPVSRYVCVSNVHVTMESSDSAEFRAMVNGADLVTPDGMPLVWALRHLGGTKATHARGRAASHCGGRRVDRLWSYRAPESGWALS